MRPVARADTVQDRWTSPRSHRWFAGSAVLLMVLVGFAVLPRDARGAVGQPFAPPPPVTYGPGWRRTANPDGTVDMTSLRTFQRWDGAWRPATSLNRSTGEWPYQLTDGPTTVSVTRLGATFHQAKIPGATYEFRDEAIKETIAIPTAPPSPTFSVAFSTTNFDVLVANKTIILKLPSGATMWSAWDFHAWDSSPVPQMWPDAITSLTYSNGVLNVTLNADMLAHAVYPLYIDPTWTLSSAVGWGASTFQDATEDRGEHTIKIGWLADDFNDNMNEIWTVDAGAVTFSGGVMNVPAGSSVHAGGSWYNQRFAFTVNFVALGSAGFAFRRVDVNNKYQLVVAGSTGFVSIEKWVGGVGTTMGSFSTSISTATTYSVKIVASVNYFEVWWQGVRKIAVTDPSPPGQPLSGYVQVWTAATNPSIKVDDVRVWNTTSGTITTPIRNAESFRPLQTEMLGSVDAYNQSHGLIRGSASNVTWGPWTNIKADLPSGILYNEPNQTQQQYYQLQVTLTSGVDGTPSVSQISTTEGALPAPSPTANTGFHDWYPYVGGLANLVNGNLYASSGDISFVGKGFSLGVVRAYNSMLGAQAGPLGQGWTFNYGQSLTINGNGNVTWNGPDGSVFLFIAKGTTGGFSPTAGVADRLVKNGDATYTLWMPDGSSEKFGSTGLLTSMSDKNGNTLTMSYSGNPSKLVTVSDSAGKALTFSYDGSNRITRVTDPKGRHVDYTYDGSNGLATFTDAARNKTQYTYYSGTPIRLKQIVDPIGKSVLANYDGNGRVTSLWLQSVNTVTLAVNWQFREYAFSYNTSTTRAVQNARGFWTIFTLNPFGNLVAMSGPSVGCSCDSGGNASTYAWDGEMNQIQRSDGRGNLWSNTFGFRGNVLTTTDPGLNVSSNAWLEVNNRTNFFVVGSVTTSFRGFTTTDAYDWRGNLLSVTDPGGNTTLFGYDSGGFLNKTVTPGGNTTWFVYNASGYLVKQKDPANDLTQSTYDVLGRRTVVTDPMGFNTTTAYDDDGRVTKVTDPRGNSTSYGYDARGDLTSVTDANHRTTNHAINVTNGKVQVTTDPGGNATTNAFDLRGNLVSVKNARNYTTSYAYDKFDRLTSVTTPLSHVTSYAYDASGNRIRRTDGNGASTIYVYDHLNRVAQTRYPGPPVYPSPQTLVYSYDQDGNLASATGFGYAETRTYDRSDRPSSILFNYGAFSRTVSYAYNRDGYRMSLKDSSGGTTKYAYDRAGRLSKITDPESLSTSLFYNPDSRENLTVELGGIRQVTLYDNAGRLAAIYTNGTSGTIESLSYAYDNAGYRLSQKDTIGQTITTTTYVYDKQSRLNRTAGSAPTVWDRYDAVGNLVAETVLRTQTLTYDADNELTQENDPLNHYVLYDYDHNGNRIDEVAWDGSGVHYYYDYENRLQSTTLGCNYTYSPTGERVTSTCGGVTTYYGYDEAGGGLANVIAIYDSGGARSSRVTHANGVDSPTELYTSGTHYAYETDALGSVKRITDLSGNTVDSYTYDSWGESTQTGSLSNPFRFAGREWDSTTSEYYNRARFYDPSSDGGHRFTSSDPGGGYAYAKDSPANFIDPTGRDPIPSSEPPGAGLTWQQKCLLSGCDLSSNWVGSSGGGGGGGTSSSVHVKATGWSWECTVLASIAVTNFIGGLVFGLAFEWFGEQAGVGAAVLASHMAMSVWIPELMMAYNIGDWGTLLAVGLQFGGFVLAAVLGGIPWWEAPIAAGAAAAEEGSGAFAINIVAAAGGLAITLADMGSHGCFSGS